MTSTDSEQRFKAVFDNTQDAILLADDDARYVDVNAAACELTGYSRDELLRMSVFDLTPVPHHSTGTDLWRAFIEAGQQTGEYPIRHKSGAMVVVEYRAVANIQPGLHLSSLRDISDRRSVEEALRLSESRLQLALDVAEIATWDIDLIRGTVEESDRLIAILGLPPGTRHKTPNEWGNYLDPNERERLGRIFRDAVDGGVQFAAEPRIVGGDGVERWIDVRGRVIRNDAGAAVRVIGICSDITKRRKAEETLLRQSLIVEHLSDGIILTDPAGTIIDWNPICERVLGYSKAEVLGRPISFFHTPENVPRQMNEIGEALMKHGRWSGEVEFVRKDGSVGISDAIVFPLTDASGRLVATASLNRDITDRKRAEAALARLLQSEQSLRAQAEKASHAKDDFLAILSHELRTPLTPVLLTVSLMETHPDLPASLRSDIAMIRRNVELESRLISDLLDLTRIAKGKMQLDMQEVDLHLLIRAAVDICQREASANLDVELHATSHMVWGDSTRLQQIFWNLINNAQKFTPADGRITIRTSDASNGRIVAEVTDTGQGINADVLPRLFTAFEQGEIRSARQFAGLGLGLAITRKLAEAHGGTVSARSGGREQGATFVIDLPVIAGPPRSAPSQSTNVTIGLNQPLSILVVEDHDATCEMLARLLRQAGHRVTTAKTLASALAVTQQDTFDLLLSDLGLPDGSGLDLMRQRREQFTHRSIALTGYGMEEDVRSSKAAGFTAHLTKPIDLQKLEAAIGDVVARLQ